VAHPCFLDLPRELQADIWARLPAADRFRLNTALPRSCAPLERHDRPDVDTDRKLGTLLWALRRRPARTLTVETVTYQLRELCTHLSGDDPSAAELCGFLPQLAPLVPATRPTPHAFPPVPMFDSSDRLTSAGIDMWLAGGEQDLPAAEIASVSGRMTPAQFVRVLAAPGGVEVRRHMAPDLLWHVVNYGNEPLLDVLLGDPAHSDLVQASRSQSHTCGWKVLGVRNLELTLRALQPARDDPFLVMLFRRAVETLDTQALLLLTARM
jgi:hypothetical protein